MDATRSARRLLPLGAVLLAAGLLAGCRLSQVAGVDAGSLHTCALVDGGGVQCWGFNAWGQLGDGTTTNRSAAVEVDGLDAAVQVSVAGVHSCALVDDGTVRCWGRNNQGQLGSGSDDWSGTPVEVAGLTGVVRVTTGWDHSCAVLDDGTARCWGDGSAGQLGDGTAEDSPAPVAVVGLTGVEDISAGTRFTCALLATGSVACWGVTQSPEVPVIPFPVVLPSISDAVQVSAGGGHACALHADGSATCWGSNFFGQLGNGSLIDTMLGGAPVVGLDDAVQVATGANHTCALRAGGTVTCWGNNSEGQLGDGTTTHTRAGPAVDVAGVADAVEITAGDGYTCARLVGGHVTCWGRNQWGQVGGAGTPVLAPREVLHDG